MRTFCWGVPLARRTGRGARGLLVVLALLVLGGCRSVWVHPEWYEGKYQSDLRDCSKGANWKICMVARGWYTETASRSAPRTRPAK